MMNRFNYPAKDVHNALCISPVPFSIATQQSCSGLLTLMDGMHFALRKQCLLCGDTG